MKLCLESGDTEGPLWKMSVESLIDASHGHAPFRTESFREPIRHLPIFSGSFMFPE
jgi:hypothetical protein